MATNAISIKTDAGLNAALSVSGGSEPFVVTRADAYLDAWVDLLAEAYLRAKNANQANGTQKA